MIAFATISGCRAVLAAFPRSLTPLGPSVEALQRAVQSAFPSASSLVVLAAYTAVFSALAVRFFKWE